MNPIKDGAGHLGRLLTLNPRIELLDLFNTGLCDSGLENFVDQLHSDTELKCIYLSINAITDIELIIRMCKKMSRLESLYLSVNRIGDEIIKLLKCGLLKNLRKLDIGSNGITDRSLPALIEFVKETPNICTIDLGSYKSTKYFKENNNNFTNKELIVELAKELSSRQGYLGLHYAYSGDDPEVLCDRLDNTGIAEYVGTQYIKGGRTRKYRKRPKELEYIYSIYRNKM